MQHSLQVTKCERLNALFEIFICRHLVFQRTLPCCIISVMLRELQEIEDVSVSLFSKTGVQVARLQPLQTGECVGTPADPGGHQ